MGKQSLLLVMVALAIGLVAGYWLAGIPAGKTDAMAQGGAEGASREPTFYRNPMNPSITSPVPAKDSMGMDYIPVFADEEAAGPAGTVAIDPVVVQNIGVRTARAERAALSHTVRAVGRIDFDEQRIARLHPKVEGWIEEMYVDTTGARVSEDTMLLSLYSPRLVASQQEYALALRNYESLKDSPIPDISRGAADLVASSRARLELMDVPEHQIIELEKSRVPQKSLHIHSPAEGVIMSIGARQGQHVTPMTELYVIADLSQVWVHADVFEHDLPWVRVGDAVEMTLAALPGEVFAGSLDYIYPYAETKTRTVKVRLVFDNPDRHLRPEMFADVLIRTSLDADALVIPAEAVIRSGVANQVFVVRAPGRFEPRVVKLGVESEGRVSVLEGLSEGEEVVTSAQFLIDSESKLREAAAKMTGGDAGTPEPVGGGGHSHHHHGGHDHGSSP
ncbi:MAG: efflux RND transporter periplasmic adaptor subunit [Pseudomonadales bacterium]|nr:efflux RND transporter periplasmic adaptor subunit [Pseudomonadales bacterium]NIX08107.1 efflux RND transporter periplasmic adaptor subunit [Pseudomonadales bacterium]